MKKKFSFQFIVIISAVLISAALFLFCFNNGFFIRCGISRFSCFFTICCILMIAVYTIVLSGKVKSFKARNEQLEDQLNKKSIELETVELNIEKIISEKSERMNKLNRLSGTGISSPIIMSNNIAIKHEIETSHENLLENDDIIILNSRQAAIGEIAGFIGHQWKQNLYGISLYTEAMKNILKQKGVIDGDTANESLVKIDSFIIEMYNNLNDFTEFIKPMKDVEYFSITDAVEETLHLMNDFITINSVEVIRDFQNDLSLTGFSNELKQVVMNIVKNAIDVFGERNCIDRIIVISIRRNDIFNIINIKDNAGGIHLDNPDGVFDKYYTSKDDGTGLGLYLSKIIIEQRFKGKIEVHNTGGGASFVISIPVFTEDTVL